jgi:hypothetical protein
MSVTREHNNSTLLSMDNKMNPEPGVGDLVRNFYNSSQIGVVIEVIDRVQSKVLWGKYSDPYSGLIGEPGYFYSPHIPLTVTLPGELNYISIDLKVEDE